MIAGETREALCAATGGGPDRAGAAARRPDDRGGHRRPPLHRPDAADRAGRRRGRPGAGRARPRGEPAHRRPGAFLPGDPGRAGDPRRVRPDHRPLVRPRTPARSRSVVAHCLGLRQNQVVCICKRMGGGVRRQGVAGRAPRAAGGAGRRPDRPAGAGRLPPRRGHAGHRQAASVPVAATGSASTPTGGSTPSSSSCTPTPAAPPTSRWRCMERSMLHADNAYFIPHMTVAGTACRTNLPSNTAMRGFGGPQGIAAIENVIEDVAAHLGLDPLEVRRRNCYGGDGRDTTHYGEVVAQQHAPGGARPAGRDVRLRAPSRRGGRFNAASRTHARGPGADAGQVRDLVHAADAQPGRCAGEHLPRRHDPGLDRRDRDGPGAQHQDRARSSPTHSRCRSRRSA